MNRLGMMYYRGIDGTPKDLRMAQSLFVGAIWGTFSGSERNLEGLSSGTHWPILYDVHSVNAMSTCGVVRATS